MSFAQQSFSSGSAFNAFSLGMSRHRSARFEMRSLLHVALMLTVFALPLSAADRIPYEEESLEPAPIVELAGFENAVSEIAASSQNSAWSHDLAERCDTGGLWNDDTSTWYDNLTTFVGLEGSKQPQEFGVNAHFGGRASINWATPIMEGSNIGLQIGTAINYTDNAVQVYERFGEARGRSQSFTTIGLFERSDSGLLWGVAWDHLHQNYYDQFDIDQFRAKLGYMIDAQNEVGVRASIGANSDVGGFLGSAIRVSLEPITQGTAYWRHFWPTGADTTMWIGVAESHGERNLAFEALLGDPRQRASGPRVVFGAEINAPLNDHFALFGQGNFITPAYTGTVDSYLGIAFYPGGGAQRARKNRFAAIMPVANSTDFSVDLR